MRFFLAKAAETREILPLITRPRTILAALLLAGVALGPRCAGTPHPQAMSASAAYPALDPDPVTASAAHIAPHPDPLLGGEGEKSDPFRATVRPVLSTRCAPCHEPDGKMYARLPFDDPKVVSENSTAMMRRLKGEDRAALERWVAGLAAATPAR